MKNGASHWDRTQNHSVAGLAWIPTHYWDRLSSAALVLSSIGTYYWYRLSAALELSSIGIYYWYRLSSSALVLSRVLVVLLSADLEPLEMVQMERLASISVAVGAAVGV